MTGKESGHVKNCRPHNGDIPRASSVFFFFFKQFFFFTVDLKGYEHSVSLHRQLNDLGMCMR